MLCPYCHYHIHFLPTAPPLSLGEGFSDERVGVNYGHKFYGGYCPNCDGIIVIHTVTALTYEDETPLPDEEISERFDAVIFPKYSSPKRLLPLVPAPIREDFYEAWRVLEISPKASAALSRRLLQRILREYYQIQKANLSQEIQEFLNSIHPPSHIAVALDAVRMAGNLAAHPLQDSNSGVIVEVDAEDAEGLLSLLDRLIDFCFLMPGEQKSHIESIEEKHQKVKRKRSISTDKSVQTDKNGELPF